VTLFLLLALATSAIPAIFYWHNVKRFRPPHATANPSAVPQISVLIPARNEERGIVACVESLLESTGVELEVIVLDDHSTDRTASLVREIAARDSRVRLVPSIDLPAGWCGKQHACFQLAMQAKYERLSFLDADVRLTPDALLRMSGFLDQSGAALVSGFPRQETETLLEQLIIPLIHWLLLGFLPIDPMRRLTAPGLGAGCGQWFFTTATSYWKVGGHGHDLVRASLHDGIKLPRAYRTCGLMTDICDATPIAVCRMYRSASQVWNGFAKNAREGLAAPKMILFWTFILAAGQILPFWLLGNIRELLMFPWQVAVLVVTLGNVWLIRLDAASRFRQPWLGAILHPLGILLLLGIQWYATARVFLGRPVGWKGRDLPNLAQ
jgi:glycosyltransferase involved in cell wall biosynthesis